MDLVRSNALATTMREEVAPAPDAIAIMKCFEKNRWLKELASRGVEESHYGLRIIKQAAKEELIRRELPHQDKEKDRSNASFDLKIEGLD